MTYTRDDGALVERCPECRVEVEVDSAEDGQAWGRAHWYAWHEMSDR